MFNAATRKRPFAAVGAAARAKPSAAVADDDGGGGGVGGGAPRASQLKSRRVATPPTTVEIRGVDVHFPFRPYTVQRDYMAGVLAALQGSQHALLESPTGTGKTLCLLCSALAWQRREKGRIAEQRREDGTAAPPPADGAAPPPAARRPPTIIYASRTHSQLSQVVGELRATRYRPRHAVLGSREHSCIHPRVNPAVAKGAAGAGGADAARRSAAEVNNGCSKLNKERRCAYRNNLEDKAGKGGAWIPGGGGEQPVLDLEDLVAVGRQHRVCPFYHSRSLLPEAELVLVPYNYLFDREARETALAEVDFANAVLIFDEAHNLEEFASESASFDLTSADVAGAVGEAQRALQYLDLSPDGEDGALRGNVLTLKSLLLRFENYLLHGIRGAAEGGGVSRPGEFIFEVFREGAGINHENLALFVDFVRRVSDIVMEFKGNTSSSGTPKLDHFVNCLKRAFGSGTDLLAMARAKSYRVHVSQMTGQDSGGFKGGRTISYWCFAPSLAMRELSFLKVRSIIITSGTLAPLPSFSMELGLNFDVTLENDHVIQSDQVFVRVIRKGVSGKELSSKYGRRDDPEYISELGSTLASLCRNIPGGVLVFFPSYRALEGAIQHWGGPAPERSGGGGPAGRGAAFFAARRRGAAAAGKCVFPMVPPSFRAVTGGATPWQRLLSRKAIVLEPRSAAGLSDAISEYKKLLSKPKSTGAILMGVCRGKISEGIDFSDDMCRAVVVTGLPFPPFMDPKVKLKREFLDAARASAKARPSIDGGFDGNWSANEAPATKKTLSGAEWYNQQAHRAVNQAIGRVIRHRHDYGAVLLLDHRFAEARNKDGLSKWLRPHLRDESFGASTRDLCRFFRESKSKTEKMKKENNDRPVIKYENPEEEEDEPITKYSLVSTGENESITAQDESIINGYVQPNLVIKRYDLKESAETHKEMIKDDEGSTAPKRLGGGTGLGALYSKGKEIKAGPNSPVVLKENQTSSFGDIEQKPRAEDTLKMGFSKKNVVKQRPQPGRRSDAAKLQAKIFFDKAQIALSREEILQVQKLLIIMKKHGESRNGQEYIKAAKELISILIESKVDCKHIELISLLFPLLPVKYRYKIERMAAMLAFRKSALRGRCKGSLTEDEFSDLEKFVQSMIFSRNVTDRAVLEDSQKILAILGEYEIQFQLLFDLLPYQTLHRVRALALEMRRSSDATKLKETSTSLKTENQNPSAVSNAPKNGEPIDAEAEKNMTLALSQAMLVNTQRKKRVIDFQRQTKSKASPANPYQRPALKESIKRNLLTDKSGRPRNIPKLSSKHCSNGSPSVVDCLHQVKSAGFVQPQTRLERISGKIKAHVPKGMICMICNEIPKEPLIAECHHSACLGCWKSWLKRQHTCPSCRAQTTMKDLSKLVFAQGTGADVPSLTQLCSHNDDKESDNEELEIITT